jgi:hypothetical protein
LEVSNWQGRALTGNYKSASCHNPLVLWHQQNIDIYSHIRLNFQGLEYANLVHTALAEEAFRPAAIFCQLRAFRVYIKLPPENEYPSSALFIRI